MSPLSVNGHPCKKLPPATRAANGIIYSVNRAASGGPGRGLAHPAGSEYSCDCHTLLYQHNGVLPRVRDSPRRWNHGSVSPNALCQVDRSSSARAVLPQEKKTLSALSSAHDPTIRFPSQRAAAEISGADELGAPRWLVGYTAPRHEKRVAQHFYARQVQCFLPVYSTERRWNDGSRVRLELPLFPSYIFVRAAREARVRALQTPGVLYFVTGTGGEPAVFPDSLIESLQQELPRRRTEPHGLLLEGVRARIRSGPLTGMEGVVVRRKGNYRVVLTLDSIKQSFAVEVSIEELEFL